MLLGVHAGLRGRDGVEHGRGGMSGAKLPGHEGLVPPGATLVGPAPSTTALPLTLTLKPRDPSALAAEAQRCPIRSRRSTATS